MKKLFTAFALSAVFSAAAVAQTYPSGVYYTRSGRQRSSQEVEAQKSLYDARRRNYQFGWLDWMRNGAQDNFQVYVSRSSNDLMNKAKKYVVPPLEIQLKYKQFLKQPNTGIVRLLAPKPCVAAAGSNKKEKLSKLIERCAADFIRGNGKYFSFRQNDYVDYNRADIGYQDNWFFSFGTLNQGILAVLGDVSLDDVTLTSKGVEYLAAYTPSSSLEGAAQESEQFEDGVDVNGVSYRKITAVEKDKTYILRVVAYDPYIAPNKNTGKKKDSAGMHLLGFDVRRDVLVAFRVIEKSEDGSLTLVWKELKRSNAPKLMISVETPGETTPGK